MYGMYLFWRDGARAKNQTHTKEHEEDTVDGVLRPEVVSTIAEFTLQLMSTVLTAQ